MIRVKGWYRDHKLEFEKPLDLPDGALVEVEISTPEEREAKEKEAWQELGMSRLEEEWDNPKDGIYDNWRKLYGA